MLLYILVGLFGAVILLGTTILGHGDHDIGHDVGHDGHDGHDGDNTPSIWSPLAVSFFLMGFGGGGTIAKINDFGAMPSALTAFGVGIGLYLLAFLLLTLTFKQQSDSSVSSAKLIGRFATIILAVAPGGQGKASCSGIPEELVVRSEDGTGIPEGTSVRIKSGAGGGVYVVQRAN